MKFGVFGSNAFIWLALMVQLSSPSPLRAAVSPDQVQVSRSIYPVGPKASELQRREWICRVLLGQTSKASAARGPRLVQLGAGLPLSKGSMPSEGEIVSSLEELGKALHLEIKKQKARQKRDGVRMHASSDILVDFRTSLPDEPQWFPHYYLPISRLFFDGSDKGTHDRERLSHHLFPATMSPDRFITRADDLALVTDFWTLPWGFVMSEPSNTSYSLDVLTGLLSLFDDAFERHPRMVKNYIHDKISGYLSATSISSSPRDIQSKEINFIHQWFWLNPARKLELMETILSTPQAVDLLQDVRPISQRTPLELDKSHIVSMMITDFYVALTAVANRSELHRFSTILNRLHIPTKILTPDDTSGQLLLRWAQLVLERTLKAPESSPAEPPSFRLYEKEVFHELFGRNLHDIERPWFRRFDDLYFQARAMQCSQNCLSVRDLLRWP